MKTIGRNEPCPCGSGKKYKFCCIGNNTELTDKTDPKEVSIPTALQSALEHHQGGRFLQAKLIYQKILEAVPNHPDALHLLGDIFRQHGNLDIAAEFIRKAIAVKPSEAIYYNSLGFVLQALGHLDQAIDNYRQAISLKPDYFVAYNNLGNALKDQNRLEDALASYRQAILLNPDFATAHLNLGVTLQMLGQLKDAAESCRRAILLSPGFSEGYFNLGIVLNDQGLFEDAVANYRRAINLNPNFAMAHNNLGNTLLKQGLLDEAVTCYRQTILLNPNFAMAHNNLGNALKRQGCSHDAINCYQKSISLEPGLVEAFYNICLLLLDLGRLTEAKVWLARGLESVGKESWRIASVALTVCWIEGLYSEARVIADQYIATLNSTSPSRLTHSARAFFIYILKLLEYKTANPDIYSINDNNARLVVLGDSHCLSPANAVFEWFDTQVTATSRITTGIKMYHLANSVKKKSFSYLSFHLNAIDPASHLLFAIGEIDCRPDEGIWKVFRKNGGLLTEIIAHTVDGYLDWIATQLEDKEFASVTLQGIPAPGYALSGEHDPGDKDSFCRMIGEVNSRLKTGAILNGWNFLDVYAATVGIDGASHGKWHLDGYHLQPAFYANAAQWLISPESL